MIIHTTMCSRCGYATDPGADELREWVWEETPDGDLVDHLCIDCAREDDSSSPPVLCRVVRVGDGNDLATYRREVGDQMRAAPRPPMAWNPEEED